MWVDCKEGEGMLQKTEKRNHSNTTFGLVIQQLLTWQTGKMSRDLSLVRSLVIQRAVTLSSE